MTDIIICGIGGKMGANILKALEDYDDDRCVGGIDAYADPSKFPVPVFKKPSDIDIDADVVVDFSRPEALQGLLDFATSRKVALLLATTGYSPEQVEAVKEASKRTAICRAVCVCSMMLSSPSRSSSLTQALISASEAEVSSS